MSLKITPRSQTNHPVSARLILPAAILLCLALPSRGAPAVAARPEGPVVLYYSRGGTTEIVARAISTALHCPAIAIHSEKKRTGMWTITCVLDQLLDRHDTTATPDRPLPPRGPIIVAAPVWIHRIASPMRTFLDSHDFCGRTAVLVLTHRGNFGLQDLTRAGQYLQSRGLLVTAVHELCTGTLHSEALDQQATTLAETIRRENTAPPLRRSHVKSENTCPGARFR